MFIDDIKNDYFYPMGTKSVVLERPKNGLTGYESEVIVHPDTARFIDGLRQKRPTWRFKSIAHASSPSIRLDTFEVFDGDENIGRIWRDTHNRTNEVRYCYNNQRLEVSRQRGYGNFSTKLQVAVKKVMESFGQKTPIERADEAAKHINSMIHTHMSNKNYAYVRAKKRVQEALMPYIENNWHTLRSYAVGESNTDLITLVNEERDSTAMVRAADSGGGSMLKLEGDSILRWRDSTTAGSSVEVITWDALTDKQRAGLGLLKLMEDKSVTYGVGARLDAKTFFILD